MRNYVNFRGRARRREFWMFTLFNTLVYLLLLAVGLVLLGAVIYKSVAEGGDAAEHATAYTLAVAGLLLLVYGWMLATFLPGLAVRVRRLHDIGLSGKWLVGYYALYWVCFYWMSTSYMQFAEDGALEGLSGQQSAAAICLGLGPYLFSPACESKHIQTIIQTAVIISTANPTPVNAIPLPFPPSISTLPIIIRIVQTNATP